MNKRRALIVRRVSAARKSKAMIEFWERRRNGEAENDEGEAQGQDIESAGSPDAELAELPDVL